MPETITLSGTAVAVLRFEIKGWKAKDKSRRLETYRELAAAGIMEAVPGTEFDYRFTEDGMRDREEILERESDRIERERQAPPDVPLSASAKAFLRQIIAGPKPEITAQNLPVLRELDAARVLYLGNSFAGGPESIYRLTYWGWHMRFEPAEMDCAKEAV